MEDSGGPPHPGNRLRGRAEIPYQRVEPFKKAGVPLSQYQMSDKGGESCGNEQFVSLTDGRADVHKNR